MATNVTEPTDSGGSTSVPPPDYNEQGRQLADGLKTAGFWERLFGVKGGTWSSLIQVAVKVFVSGLDDVLALGVQAISSAQGTNTPGFFALVAAVLSDLIGVEVSSSAYESSFRSGGDLGAIRSIGASFYDFLAGQFATGSTLTPDSGLAAAKAFLGFLMGFSVRQGNISFIAELVPEEFNVLGGLREYGEEMERSLGLGRLSRVAFTPLIKTLVADPLQWSLNAQYRPKLLAEAQYVKALQRGLIDRATFDQFMSWLGYRDEDLDTVIADLSKLLAASESARLVRYGEETLQDATNALTAQGYDPADAQAALLNEDLARADAWTAKELALYVKQVEQGTASIPDVQSNIDSLPLGDQEKQAILHYLGAIAEFPRAFVTLAQIEDAYLRSVADLSEVEAVLSREGYSAVDAMTLELILLDKANKAEAKAELAAAKCAARKAAAIAKGNTPPIC